MAMSDNSKIEPRGTFVAIPVTSDIDLRTLDPEKGAGQAAGRPPKYLYIGGGGTLVVVSQATPRDAGSSAPVEANVTFVGLTAGFQPIAPIKIKSTGTTVTNVVGVW